VRQWYRFNPRPRTAGDTAAAKGGDTAESFQSTPAHGGRRHGHAGNCRALCVSIHARARRATQLKDGKAALISVSIHARARRATGAAILFSPSSSRFNPRPRTAGDSRRHLSLPRSYTFQSTPAHGGRRTHNGKLLPGKCFNPRPRTAGDA